MSEMQEFLEVNADAADHATDIEINFGRIFKSLWHFAWLIALLAVLGSVLMYGYTKLMLTPEYQSTASVYIHDKNVTASVGDEDSPESETFKYNTESGNTATYLKNTYRRVLTSDTTLKIVIENLGLNCSAGTLRSRIRSSAEDYPFFDITVTCNDPEDAARIANELADVLYEQVSKIVGGSALTHVDKASASYTPTGPNTTKNVLLGFIAGFMLACVIIVVVELSNNKINDDDYLINTYGISVLATVSDAGQGSHKGYGYYKYGYHHNTARGE